MRLKKARMEDGALETVRKLGGHASFIQTLTLLREKVVVSYLEIFFFFSVTMKSSTANSYRAMQQIAASPQGIYLCSVNPKSYSVALRPVRSSTLHCKWERPQEDRERPKTGGWSDSQSPGSCRAQNKTSFKGRRCQADSLTKILHL